MGEDIIEESLWENEEFEEHVAKGIISLLEPPHKKQKKANPAVQVRSKDISRLKSYGNYFPPKDRLFDASGMVDLKVDPIPNYAALSFGHVSQSSREFSRNSGSDHLEGYVHMHWLERIKSLPKKWRTTGPGSPFAVYWAYAREEGGILFCKWIVTICHKSGNIYACQYVDQWNDGIRHRVHVFEGERDEEGCHKAEALTSIMINAWSERRIFWNVQAIEGRAKALFGVYPEQIKSLFYARDLPRTKTGRKSPILHWVSAHRRRMENGTEIDIENHLRGASKIEMNGTTFEITYPQKQA